MTDPTESPQTREHPASSSSRPRIWVRVVAILAAIGLLVVVAVLHLTGTMSGGLHG